MTISARPATRVAVVLASAGRPEILADVLEDVRRQTHPDIVTVVAVPDADSLPSKAALGDVIVAAFARGLTRQRNAGLDAIPDATHVFFFDDDAILREDYVAQAMEFFDDHQEVVALTGRVLMDGATTEAVPLMVGRAAVQSSLDAPRFHRWAKSRTLYGCNFAVRADVARAEKFDDRLPLYGWLEDHDFARRAMRHGRLAAVTDCVIVHRGYKSGGRTAHKRLGYAQVMNPAYFVSRRSFPLWLAAWEIARPVAKNVSRSVAHTESRWRRERLLGNGLAALDLLRFRFTPERGLALE